MSSRHFAVAYIMDGTIHPEHFSTRLELILAEKESHFILVYPADVVVFNKLEISRACRPSTQPIVDRVVSWIQPLQVLISFLSLLASVRTKHAEEIVDRHVARSTFRINLKLRAEL